MNKLHGFMRMRIMKNTKFNHLVTKALARLACIGVVLLCLLPLSAKDYFWDELSRCERHTTNGMTWVTPDNKVAVIMEWPENAKSITVPAKIGGYPVVAFSWYFEYDGSREYEDFIPDTVESISAESSSQYFSSVDGVLFNKEKTTLIRYPERKKNSSYTVPQGVTRIGDSSFADNCFLQNIKLLAGVQAIGLAAFEDCEFLDSITLPDSLTVIEEDAFESCPFTSFTIPKNVSKLGPHSFQECNSLKAFSVASGNKYFTSVDGVLFDSSKKTLVEFPPGKGASYTIPNGTEAVGDGAFYENTKLKSITFPNTLKTIGKEAFVETDLTSVTIPASVTYIGDWAFCYIDNLNRKNVTFLGEIPENAENAFDFELIESTPESSFDYRYDYDLGGIVITMFIGSETDIVIPRKIDWTPVVGVDDYAFSYSSIKSVVIPKGVTFLGVDAFYDCISLTSVSLPAGLTSIGVGAFAGCTSLTGVSLPAGLTSIEEGAFYYCTSLASVSLPASVEQIGVYAFGGIPSLKTVAFAGKNSAVEDDAFAECDNIESVYFQDGLPKKAVTFGGSSPTIYANEVDTGIDVWNGYPVVFSKASPLAGVVIQAGGVSTLVSGAKLQLSCLASYANGRCKEVNPTWTFTPSTSPVTLSAQGLLTVLKANVESTVTVKASYSENGVKKEATLAIKVKPLPTIVSTELSCASHVRANGTLPLELRVKYSDGRSETVSPTWRIVSGGDIASIDTNGRLTTLSVSENTSVTIEAVFEYGGDKFTRTVSVDVQPQVFNDSVFQYSYILQPGWNSISIVLDLLDGEEDKLLALSPYAYDSTKSSFVKVDHLEGGMSCWIHVDKQTAVTVKGNPMGALAQ